MQHVAIRVSFPVNLIMLLLEVKSNLAPKVSRLWRITAKDIIKDLYVELLIVLIS